MYQVSQAFGIEYSRNDRARVAAGPVRGESFQTILKHLPAEDRRLAQLVLVEGRSHRAVGRLMNANPGVITRRARRLRNQLASPTVRAIAEHIDTLSGLAREIAIDHFLRRVSVSLLCVHRNLPRREVVAQLEFIRGWARALHRAQTLTRAARPTEDDDAPDSSSFDSTIESGIDATSEPHAHAVAGDLSDLLALGPAQLIET